MTGSDPLYNFDEYPCRYNCGQTVQVYWDVHRKLWHPLGDGSCDACQNKEREERLRSIYLSRANLTEQESLLTIDTFRVSEETREAYDAARRMIMGDSINLYLCGKAGRGKTHLGISILMGRMETTPGKFIPITKWLMEVRSDLKHMSEDRWIEKILDCPLVVMDDFGANKLTEWNLSFLDCLIDEWYRRRKKGLIITSNFNLKEVSEKISDRMASRLAQLCEVYELGGKDWRI